MDCSLSTWPSITQFEDLTWMGLGDIDPLESLDRSFDNHCQFNETSFTNPGETKPASPPARAPHNNDTSVQIAHTKSDDFYRLTSSESLAAARWESINAVDLASVLDNFPSSNDTPTPGEEDVYDLYSESILMQAETQISGGEDVYMSDSMSDRADANNTMRLSDDKSSMNAATVMSSDHTSLSNTPEDMKCDATVGNNDSPASVNLSQVGMENSVLTRIDRSAHHVEYVDNGGAGSRVNLGQAPGCFAFQPMKFLGCADPCPSSQCTLNLKESVAPLQHDSIQPGMMIHWSNPQPTMANTRIFDGEQVVQHSPMRAVNNYPAILDQQARMADAARVTSELKRNRAQASRARRLAATQRRAKKYPLQKLIRMSSSSANTREKLDQNMIGAAAAPLRPLQPVSQSQVAATTATNSQLPSFLPVVLQGAHLASSHELLSQANAMQGVPYYHYQHHPTGPCEDNLVSPSGSSTLQPKHSDQDPQPMSTIPSLVASYMTNPTQSLDVILLDQLQSIISKFQSVQMNVDMRLCIRDAMYRLARSAKCRQNRIEIVSGSDVNASHAEVMETHTNSIDRWIVNMLFCKQPASFEANSQPYFTQAPDHTTENANTNSNMQQWNSCGSSMNLQDQPLHVVTGL